jgi:hypothetical protein
MVLDAMLVVRFPQDVKDALHRAAEDDARSMSSMCLIIIREGLQERGYLEMPKKPVRGPRRK